MSALDSGTLVSPSPKKIKLDICEKDPPVLDTIHGSITDLSTFQLTNVLSNNTNRKSIFLRGSFEGKDGEAVLIFEKTAFSEEQFNNGSGYFTEKSKLSESFQNDIYGEYKYFPTFELSSFKTTIIHPATEKHIQKFSAHRSYLVDETPKIYSDIILPCLSDEESHLQWVYNILEHKSEVDRIFFEDTDPENGFVMVPDLKWNGENIDTLYFLVIVNKHNIKSLRDLTSDHLPLLRNIKHKGIEAIKSKHSLDGSRLRIYLHYHPSFYHLHVHFCNLKHEAPGLLAEKAHMLSNVISNIELFPQYYQKVTIPFVVRENDKLFKKPRLQSVNAFISLSAEQDYVEVVLEKESIRLIIENGTEEVPCNDINIVQNSLSSMKVTNKFLMFRFATNNSFKKIGGFKTELLQNTVASMESLSNKPLLSKNTGYTIHCINCGKCLTNCIKFDRVLPLPSENADVGEWFCHDHGNQMNGMSLDPKDTEVFYSQCFVHLNIKSVLNIRNSGKLIVCKFCLQWLGVRHNAFTIRLWLNTVKFLNSNNCISTSSLDDVFKTIKSVFNHSIHGSFRIILTCQTSSNCVDGILIWILEKNLQILFNGSGKVKKYEVAKVLFKFVNSDETVFKLWEKDSMVSTLSVSKIMMVDLLKHLHKFNKLFPPEYSESNDFKISYLFLQD
ncbi:hypothetical protein JTB14_030219 [Gonioctena quinquepunctata]|nr:hypothetical protein JTB14_030219 [Gonioctena quinquepunctata]